MFVPNVFASWMRQTKLFRTVDAAVHEFHLVSQRIHGRFFGYFRCVRWNGVILVFLQMFGHLIALRYHFVAVQAFVRTLTVQVLGNVEIDIQMVVVHVRDEVDLLGEFGLAVMAIELTKISIRCHVMNLDHMQSGIPADTKLFRADHATIGQHFEMH